MLPYGVTKSIHHGFSLIIWGQEVGISSQIDRRAIPRCTSPPVFANTSPRQRANSRSCDHHLCPLSFLRSRCQIGGCSPHRTINLWLPETGDLPLIKISKVAYIVKLYVFTRSTDINIRDVITITGKCLHIYLKPTVTTSKDALI